ncbi:WxL domain-containing protein, partial [Enterococcus faecalis]
STPTEATYYTIDKPIYYYLTNRKVTENFVDASGAKITAPTGFKQGKQTVIDSDDFTYTQEGTLPYIYKINNKPYVLKGWYKGKEKPAKLNQITKEKPNISYPVSYDDQDDVTVVYDELKLAGNTIQFGFVNEQGNYIPPTSKFNVSTDIGEVTNAAYTKLQTVNSTINGNYLSLTIPAYNPTGGIGQGNVYYGSRNSIVTIPNYYKPPTLTPPSNYNGTVYPTATGVADYHDAATYAYLPSRLNLTPVSGSQTNYRLPQAIWTDEETKTAFSSLYKMNATSTSDTTMGLAEIYATGTVNYYLENRRVTENFVDDTGAKITPPADFTQGKQTVIDSDNFTYTSAKALPASYTADGKSYVLQGWYKGTEKPTTLETSKTPSYSVTYNDQDDLTVVYKEGTISADLTMRGAVDVIDNGAPMEYWEVLLKNTGEVPLTSIKIKPTTDWASGISAPTELFILGTGQNAKARPITKEQWEAGFEIPLDSSLPVGGQLTINLIGTKVTGQPGQVLKAAVEVTGNFGSLKASDTVRIKDLDQEIKEPTGEGFISVPTFDFGQVGVASATKQHGLKKAADYYGNGTRNPYVRISKTQPNWSLTAQLSQPKSATDSLPTATRLLLGAAPVSSFSNYNQPTELKNAIGTTNAIHLTANNAATSIIANQQFTGSDVYQLDFTFDNIKLEVPANQGTAGQQYQAAVTWNLVTGP